MHCLHKCYGWLMYKVTDYPTSSRTEENFAVMQENKPSYSRHLIWVWGYSLVRE